MISDMHVHTHFSIDSRASFEQYCIRALETGTDCICFTDHVECNPLESDFGFYDANRCFDEFHRAQDTYGDRLRLLLGVEFSEPHLYPRELEAISKQPYDFILGSVHFWYQNMFPSEMVKAGIPESICYEKYWESVYAAVSFGGFDCLGHMDFPKRYYMSLLMDPATLKDIFQAMLKNNICLEINTSTLRKGLSETMPDRSILELYRSAGGKYATIGSDAHTPEDLAAGRAYAKGLLRVCGLTEVTFEKRTRIPIEQ